MPPVRLSIALPSVQLLLAVAMSKWGLWTICYGIDAPAIVFKALALPWTNQWPPSVFAFDLEQFFFFMGIIILWFLVGDALDKYKLRKMPIRAALTLGKILRDSLLMILGITLFLGGIAALRTPGRWHNHVDIVAEGILFILWSLVLFGLPSVELLNAIRRRSGAQGKRLHSRII